MHNKKIIYGILFFLVLILLALSIIVFSLKKKNSMEITFLDVGQGDAILLEQGSNQVLIDGGRSGAVLLERLGKNMPFWDRKIEAIIITHPDIDHYGGLMGVLDNYKVKNVIKTDAVKKGNEWKVFEEKIRKENVEKISSIYGMNIVFPNGSKIQTIYPFEKIDDSREGKNDDSTVMRLDFGENSFLFTGDIEKSSEDVIINSNVDIDVDVLKLAHHGSRSSSGDVFIEKVSPEDAIISVGAKNSYGHPHKEILDKLEDKLIRIWRTDEDGDIVYICKNMEEKCQVFAN